MASNIKCVLLVLLSLQIVCFFIYLTYYVKTSKNVKAYQTAQFRICNSTDASSFINSFRVNEDCEEDTLELVTSATRNRSVISNHTNNHSSGIGNTPIHQSSNFSAAGLENDRKFVTNDKRTSTDQPGTFHSIDKSKAWVYSAHYDHVAAQNGHRSVRVFGLADKVLPRKVYCAFSRDNVTIFTNTVIVTLPQTHKKRYQPIYIDCSLPEDEKQPTYVSVSFKNTKQTTNRLQILYPGPRSRNFTVCYSVLHSRFNRPTQLIESIEVNRLLGAEHFMVYNHSISPNVSHILSAYQKEGLVTVLQWRLPTSKSWYCAQMTALNDCLFRNRNISKYVVIVDTDELIIPRPNKTWMEVIHSVSPQNINNSSNSSKNDNLSSCFYFMSSVFPLDQNISSDFLNKSDINFTTNEMEIISKYKIIVLSKFKRANKIYRYYVRSKYIASPEDVQVTGVHYVYKFTSPNRCVKVSTNMALVHHYRRPFLKDSNPITDMSMLKFKQQLLPRILHRIKRLPTIFP